MPGWQRTTLDGIWEGRGGALLIVQSHRFRLYSSQGGYIDGLIQQRGDRLALSTTRSTTGRAPTSLPNIRDVWCCGTRKVRSSCTDAYGSKILSIRMHRRRANRTKIRRNLV